MTLEDWAEGYRLAWVERDADAAAALFTPEATYRDNIVEEPHRGRDAIHAYWTGVTALQSDVRVRMGRPFGDGKRATVEFWTNMKHEANDGGEVTIPGCLLLDFDDDGLCTRLREYWQFLPEAHDPPEEWGQ